MKQTFCRLLVLLAFLATSHLFAAERHLRIKPLVGSRYMAAAQLNDDFAQTQDHWMAFLKIPPQIDDQIGHAWTLGAEVSLPLMPCFSTFGKILYFRDENHARSSSQNASYPIYAISAYGSDLYTISLIVGGILYKEVEDLKNTLFYVSLGTGVSTIRLKRRESYELVYDPVESITWEGKYTDVGYYGELILGCEVQMKRWCFLFLEGGYSYMSFGTISGREQWTCTDRSIPYSDPFFAHDPPITFTYPYDGVIEETDAKATKPDGSDLKVNLNGFTVYAGLGLNLF